MPASIHACVGLNGAGKTLAMVEFGALPALKKGRPVFANFRINHEGASLISNFREVEKLRGCTLLLDEITSVFPSRQSQSLPPQFARMLNQLRKPDVDLWWTAPSWARADRLLREVTSEVWWCRGMFPERGSESRWPKNRFFRFRAFAAEDYEEFTIDKAQKLKAVERRWYLRRRHEAYKLYDTLESVDLIAHLDDVGLCVDCGGSRSRPKCICPRRFIEAAEGAPAPVVADAPSEAVAVNGAGSS